MKRSKRGSYRGYGLLLVWAVLLGWIFYAPCHAMQGSLVKAVEYFSGQENTLEDHIQVQLSNEDFYCIFRTDNSDFDTFKTLIRQGDEVTIEEYRNDLSRLKISSKDIVCLARYSEKVDAEGQVFSCWE